MYLDENILGKYPDDENRQDGYILINSIGTLGCVGFYHVTDNHGSLPIVPNSYVTFIRTYSDIHAFYTYTFMKAN